MLLALQRSELSAKSDSYLIQGAIAYQMVQVTALSQSKGHLQQRETEAAAC